MLTAELRTRLNGDADGALLSRFLANRDEESFADLVHRWGPMVLGVCRRVLGDFHLAEDAFQATFLVLARKAESVYPQDRVGVWLYGVALRTAMKSRGRRLRRQEIEQHYGESRPTSWNDEDTAFDGLAPLFDSYLNALPEKYRLPLILSAVHGLAKAEVAEQLGLPEGTVSSRLARGRDMLRDRLARRGFAVPVAALGALLASGAAAHDVPYDLAATTAEVGTAFAHGHTLGSSPMVVQLTHEVLRSMTLFHWKTGSIVAILLAASGGGFGLSGVGAEEKPKPKPAAVEKKPDAAPTKPTKPAEPAKPKPAPEKGTPVKKFEKVFGAVTVVDANANTLTLSRDGDGGKKTTVLKLAENGKVLIDGEEAKLADIPKGALASAMLTEDAKEVGEVRVTGPTIKGLVKAVDKNSITITKVGEDKDGDHVVRFDAKTPTKGTKIDDIKVGDKVAATLATDGKSVLTLSGGKPAEKPDGTKKPSETEKKPTVKGEPEKKPAVKGEPEKKPAVKGEPEKKPDPEKKPAVKGEPEKKPAEKPAPEKKPAVKGEPEKKPGEKPAPEKKPAVKGEPEKKPGEKPAPETKPTTKPDPVKKPGVKGDPEKKPAVKGEPTKSEKKPAVKPDAVKKPVK